MIKQMGPGIVILLWLFVAGFYGAVVLVFSGLWLLGKKKNWRWLKWLAGIPAAGLTLAAVMGVSLLIYGVIDGCRPSSVFRETFGAAPSPQIQELNSQLFWFADTGSVYLRFKTTPEVFQRLIPEGLAKTLEISDRFDLERRPDWWKPTLKQSWLVYQRVDGYKEGQDVPSKPFKKGFYSETEFFAYDPETQTAYYHFSGID